MPLVSFWQNVERIVGITKPFVDFLRPVDSEKFIFRQVYWIFSNAIQFAKDYTQYIAREESQIVSTTNTRWGQMRNPLHKDTFALEPKFQLYN